MDRKVKDAITENDACCEILGASAKDRQMVLENVVPPLFDAVLFDYQKNVPAAREPRVLSLLSTIVTKLGSMLASQVALLAVVSECTLEMINKDVQLCRAFEDIFDDLGDTLPWKYTGSQFVHSIKTYKKMSALQNTFGDYDKQAAINRFLGVFRPQISTDIEIAASRTDYYLHLPTYMKIDTDYCAWMHNEDELEKAVELARGC